MANYEAIGNSYDQYKNKLDQTQQNSSIELNYRSNRSQTDLMISSTHQLNISTKQPADQITSQSDSNSDHDLVIDLTTGFDTSSKHINKINTNFHNELLTKSFTKQNVHNTVELKTDFSCQVNTIDEEELNQARDQIQNDN